MKCPACQADVVGREICPSCGTMVAPAVIGALAPDPARQTPPSRGKGALAPQRDVASRKGKDIHWKDEVRERVQKRRRRKQPRSGELPFQDEPQAVSDSPPNQEVDRIFADAVSIGAPGPDPAPSDLPSWSAPSGPSSLGEDAGAASGQRVELGDEPPGERELPLRADARRERLGEPALDLGPPAEASEPTDAISLVEAEDDVEEWPAASTPRPVERPAGFGDRLEAGALDLGLLLIVDALVVYFAGRRAQAELSVLLQQWPWLFGFLAFLGLAYAGWFTGTTGQTPGKMLVGLRVVDRAGRPPGYARAMLRAALGTLTGAALGLGVAPLFFDPARRTLSDRLLRTRVVKS